MLPLLLGCEKKAFEIKGDSKLKVNMLATDSITVQVGVYRIQYHKFIETDYYKSRVKANTPFEYTNNQVPEKTEVTVIVNTINYKPAIIKGTVTLNGKAYAPSDNSDTATAEKRWKITIE